MPTFTVKAAESDAEYFDAFALTSLVFHGGVDAEGIVGFMDSVNRRPGSQRDQHRIGVLDGKVVSRVIVSPFTLRYGEGELTFGGIGAVCTHPDHRMKGYAAAVMRDSVEYMRARGYHLSLLNTGEENFYTKIGYQTLWSDGTVEIETAQALNLNSRLKPRAAAVTDMPQMAALFDRMMAGRVTTIRTQAMWAWRMADDPDQHRRVVENDSGQIVGYVVGFYENRQIEMVAESDEAVAALLADSARIFQDGGPEKLSILVTPDDLLLHRIRRMVVSQIIVEFNPGANWMARIVDAESFREAILPEMARQAGVDQRDLILSIQLDSVHLGLDSIHVELDHETFLQVLFGILPPAVLPLHSDAVGLLERLFPRRDFVIYPWDWF